MLFVVVGLLVSIMISLNEFKNRPIPINNSNSNSGNELVKQKMASVESEIARNNKTAYEDKNVSEALIAAERAAAQYQVLKLLDLPLDAQQQQNAEKLVADIRANYRPQPERLDDERQFYALT